MDITSVILRAGWSLGGVQDRYIRFAGAGDMFVGRCVAGNSLHSQDFSYLPPHFPEAGESVREMMKLMFPSIFQTLSGVAEFCLASLVYHETYLRETLSAHHP